MKKNVVRAGRTIKTNTRQVIPVSGLKVGMYVAELDRPWLETPFILQGFEIKSVTQIEEIAQHCQHVYVDESRDSWQGAEERVGLGQARKRIHAPPSANQKSYERARLAYHDAQQLTRSFMDDVRFGRGINIQAVKKTVSELVKNMLADPGAMMWMSKLRNKDEYTAEHSLNVGMLAINFGRHMKLSEEDLISLGIAGMLHDVGKMRTPLEVLNKPGKLEPEEFKQMMAHARNGRDILMSHRTVDHSAIDVAFTHHEMLDGSGYPRKVNAKSINDFTRMVTVCDIYDAITSERIYKKGQSSREALNILHQGRGKKFDQSLVDKFIECIGLYPPGSIVELGSGEVGIVISINYRHRHLPKVMIIRDAQKMPQREQVINLEKVAQAGNNDRLIKSVLPNGNHGVRIEHFIKKGLKID